MYESRAKPKSSEGKKAKKLEKKKRKNIEDKTSVLLIQVFSYSASY